MNLQILLLNLPDPPGRVINRGYAGGYGTAYDVIDSTKVRPVLPIYLLYAASALESAGCRYDVLDAQGSKCGVEVIKKTIKDLCPEVVLSWISLPSFHHDLRCLEEVKAALGGNGIVVGWGTTCNALTRDILQNRGVDMVLRGEYPYYGAIQTFAEKMKKGSRLEDIPGVAFLKGNEYFLNSRIASEVNSLDRLSLSVYHRIPLSGYINTTTCFDGTEVEYLPIITSAGCSHTCGYCPYPVGYGRKIKYKSIDKIIEEIKFLKSNFGIRCFLFRDQNFLSNKERALELCRRIIEEDLDVMWFIEARADQISRNLLQQMKRAGCIRIHFGVESGSQKLIKTAKPGSNLDRYFNAFRLCREMEIATLAHLIIGLPGENQKTVKETLDFLKKLKPDYINVNILTPYPGTRLYEAAIKNNWIRTFDWSRYTSYNAVMGTDELTPEEIENLRRYIRRRWKIFKLMHKLQSRVRAILKT